MELFSYQIHLHLAKPEPQETSLTFFPLRAAASVSHLVPFLSPPSRKIIPKLAENTVDGSEIRGSPVDMVNIPMIFRVL